MERLIGDAAGLLRSQAMGLRHLADLLDEAGREVAARKATYAQSLVLEAARELEAEVLDETGLLGLRRAPRVVAVGAEVGTQSCTRYPAVSPRTPEKAS